MHLGEGGGHRRSLPEGSVARSAQKENDPEWLTNQNKAETFKNSYRVDGICMEKERLPWLLVFETGNHNGILQMKIDR